MNAQPSRLKAGSLPLDPEGPLRGPGGAARSALGARLK